LTWAQATRDSSVRIAPADTVGRGRCLGLRVEKLWGGVWGVGAWIVDLSPGDARLEGADCAGGYSIHLPDPLPLYMVQSSGFTESERASEIYIERK